MAGQLKIGTSGWSYQHWKGLFYPDDLPTSKWLQYYTEHFDTVELNASFYRLFPRSTFEGWRQKVPEGFVYAVKLWRGITHLKKLSAEQDSLDDVIDRMEGMGEALGPVLVQIPPSLHLDMERLEAFARMMPSRIRWALEVRHSSWFVDELWEVLKEHNAAFCMADSPGESFPRKVTTDFAYVRFHGEQVTYAGKYSKETLQDWAAFIGGVLDDGKDVYAYFNNDIDGHAVTDARQLQELIMG
jgi:uncharacterized protein YecE (DUF72 family)